MSPFLISIDLTSATINVAPFEFQSTLHHNKGASLTRSVRQSNGRLPSIAQRRQCKANKEFHINARMLETANWNDKSPGCQKHSKATRGAKDIEYRKIRLG